MAELRIWSEPRTAEQVADFYNRRLVGAQDKLLAHLPMEGDIVDTVADRPAPTVNEATMVRCDDLPIVPGRNVVTAEYSTMSPDPADPTTARPLLRRCYAVATDSGEVTLLPGKKIEDLELQWIGNAQFKPTLLGFIEGAPPAPSENLTINYDYDGATSVELRQSEEAAYSWVRDRDSGSGFDANTFIGGKWETSVSVGMGVSLSTKATEGRVGARASMNAMTRRTENTTIRANSTEVTVDKLDLRGSFEGDPKFVQLGNRYVPKNVGYALVVSGMADVFVMKLRRTGRMVAYEVRPVDDMPLDVNTITFLINPAYQINGSLDGLVGTKAADERFCKDVPEMRAQYGSLYPSGYFNPRQAYDLKAQIERWDKLREAYFTNFDAREVGLGDNSLSDVPDEDQADEYGQTDVDAYEDEGDDTADGDGSEEKKKKSGKDMISKATAGVEGLVKKGGAEAKQKQKDIKQLFKDQGKRTEANAAFRAWQTRMESLRIRAAKRNLVNTYVWDADGGLRTEEQNFVNTVEHTLGGSYTMNTTAGGSADVSVAGFAFELEAMGQWEVTQSLSKTSSTTNTLDLNIQLDGLEKKGITDADDYPLLPGEKVDRYRFMSFYLEGDTDHFHDFFDHVVDPQWLMSNDEEARALRQVEAGKANKAWRVLHRVTYVERPSLMGFGRDMRVDEGFDAVSEQVFGHFDALVKGNDAIKAEVGVLKSTLGGVDRKLDELQKAADDAGGGGQSSTGESVLDLTDSATAAAAANGSAGSPVLDYLNVATPAMLEQVNGIGASTATAILAERDQLGMFTSLDELVAVSGISAESLDQLQQNVLELLNSLSAEAKSTVAAKPASSSNDGSTQ